MKKIKHVFKVVFTLGILFLIFPLFIFFLSGVFSFFGKYEIASHIDEIFLGVFPKNRILLEKIGNDFYRQQDFLRALQTYEKISCQKQTFCARVFHNMGNAFFWQAEESFQDSSKISFYQKSLNAYLKSLEIENTPETQHNYEVVLEKLNRLLKPDPSHQSQQSSGESPNWQEESGAWNISSEQDSNDAEKKDQEILDTVSRNNGLGGEESLSEKELSAQELEEIQRHTEELWEFDLKNRKYNSSERRPFFTPFWENNDW